MESWLTSWLFDQFTHLFQEVLVRWCFSNIYRKTTALESFLNKVEGLLNYSFITSAFQVLLQVSFSNTGVSL